MKHIKNRNDFFSLNEQLFGSAINKFTKEIFGSGEKEEKDSQESTDSEDKTSVGSPTSSNSSGSSSSSSSNPPVGPAKPASEIGEYGKFSAGKQSTSPLVIVFGGIDVGGRKSGNYMYDYFNKTGDKYNLFVAKDHRVKGVESYEAAKQKAPSATKKILYLFSGGYNPGMQVLKKYGAKEFDKIYLVDIWMGNEKIKSFYIDLARQNPDKVEYYYTSGGAVNPSARDGVASSVKNKVKNSKGHMATNIDAVESLIKSV